MKRPPPPPTWSDDLPIYRQLMDHVTSRILDQTYLEGEMLPSVRQLASDFNVNPLTVAKAYREFSRDGLIEKLRGEGLILRKGVREILLKRERNRFLQDEWPALKAKLKRLGIDVKSLANEK